MQIIGQLIDEVKALRESFHQDYNNVDKKLDRATEAQKGEFNKLEVTIAPQKNKVIATLSDKIETNATNINQLLEENRILKKENDSLRECITKIEVAQMSNNIMLSGMPEQPLESYESTKERVIEAIASSMGSKDDEAIKVEVKKVEIMCCSRVGTYRLGKPRPISVTFEKKDDNEKLIATKKNLPPGIYVNQEYPIHIKRARHKVRSILKLVKSIPHYRDKSKLVDDKLVVNGISYGVDDIPKLPLDLVAYQAVEKLDENTSFSR